MEFEATLPNGFTVGLFEHEGKIIVELTNGNGFVVTDMPLTSTEAKQIRTVLDSIKSN